jgi:hypothetical protein
MPFIFTQLSLTAAAAQLNGVNYTQWQEVTQSTAFRYCTFHDCSGRPGGAIYIRYGTNISLEIADCLFANCQSASFGGAIEAVNIATFLMNQTCCFNCSAQQITAWDTKIASPVTGRLEVHESSATSCSAILRQTLCLESSTDAGGPPALVDGVNSSANCVGESGSGLETGAHFNFSFHFSIFCSNSRGACLCFDSGILNSDISCLTLRNNTVEPDTYRPSLLSVYSTVTLRNCVFQVNLAAWFVEAVAGEAGSISLVACVIDSESLTATGSLSFSTADCTSTSDPTDLAECSALAGGGATPPVEPPTEFSASASLPGSARPASQPHQRTAFPALSLVLSGSPLMLCPSTPGFFTHSSTFSESLCLTPRFCEMARIFSACRSGVRTASTHLSKSSTFTGEGNEVWLSMARRPRSLLFLGALPDGIFDWFRSLHERLCPSIHLLTEKAMLA